MIDCQLSSHIPSERVELEGNSFRPNERQFPSIREMGQMTMGRYLIKVFQEGENVMSTCRDVRKKEEAETFLQ